MQVSACNCLSAESPVCSSRGGGEEVSGACGDAVLNTSLVNTACSLGDLRPFLPNFNPGEPVMAEEADHCPAHSCWHPSAHFIACAHSSTPLRLREQVQAFDLPEQVQASMKHVSGCLHWLWVWDKRDWRSSCVLESAEILNHLYLSTVSFFPVKSRLTGAPTAASNTSLSG